MDFYRTDPRKADVVIVAFNGFVFALEPESGVFRWEVEVEGTFVRIVLEDDRVYALGQSLVAIELATGKPIFRQWTPGSTLLVEDERILVGGNGEVHAFAKRDGRPLWSQTFPGRGLGAVAIAAGGRVVQADG
jgi:outer membrane protein assembly factor BamB